MTTSSPAYPPTFHPPSTWRTQFQGFCPPPPKRERDIVKMVILLSKVLFTVRKLNIPLLLCTETLVYLWLELKLKCGQKDVCEEKQML